MALCFERQENAQYSASLDMVGTEVSEIRTYLM